MVCPYSVYLAKEKKSTTTISESQDRPVKKAALPPHIGDFYSNGRPIQGSRGPGVVDIISTGFI